MDSEEARLERPPELVSEMNKMEVSGGVETQIRQTIIRKAVVQARAAVDVSSGLMLNDGRKGC